MPAHVLVRFRPGVARTQRDRLRIAIGASKLRSYDLVPGLELIKLGAGVGVLDAIASLSTNPAVEYATPDALRQPTVTPNDEYYGAQWNMDALGAPAAWDRTTGSAAVTVAMLDTGIQLSHPDLSANLWTNTAEIPGNWIDDDGNGFVDDVHGWDFANGDNDPSDEAAQYGGHGTFTSGIVGAVGNNGSASPA